MNMTYTLTYPTRTEPAMPYELLLAIWLFLCGGLWGGFTALLQNLVVRGLCVLQMCCKSAVAKFFLLFIRLIKKLPIFVVRDTLNINSNDKFYHYKKAEQSKWGSVSVQVRSLIRCLSFGVSRSDYPSFVKPKSFIVMRDTIKTKKNLSVLHERWAVAELEVSYKPKQKIGVTITCADDAYQVFRQMWDNSLINIQEQFCCLFLNAASEVIGFRLITTGKATSNTIDFNFIITCALLCRAQQVIFAHNHPSGNTKPSKADRDVTNAAKWKLEPFEVDVTDHIIITDSDYYSFIDNGLILKN